MSKSVHINGVEYPYLVGKDFVVARLPNGMKLVELCHRVKNIPADIWDAAKWNKDPVKGSVKPSEVKAWIEEKLLLKNNV